MTWTIKAIQIVPDDIVNKQRTNPKGMAPMVSSKPFGMWVAEYKAILMAIAGHIPNGSIRGINKTPLNKNSYPNKYKNHPRALMKIVFFVQILALIWG